MAKAVLTTPVIAAILIGTVWGLTGLPLPSVVRRSVDLVSQAAIPLSLIAMGMGLAEYGIYEGLHVSTMICTLKLIAHPLVVLLLARWLRLPPIETHATVLLASLPVGVQVYLMSRQFETLGGPVAASLVLSTALAAATTPLLLALIVRL
jgi:malonate transporter and related proteins